MKLLIVLLAFLISACASIEGAYRGPERFGREQYQTELPRADLSKRIRVVLMTFKDERPKRPGLDWTRQAELKANTLGQPTEVRIEVERAIRAGLAKHPNIQVVSPEEFLQTRDADIVLSGKILRCEAQREATDFVGQTFLEVTARDEFGNSYWNGPLRVRTTKRREYKDSGYFDEIEPGKVAAVVSDSIEGAATDLMARRSLIRAFERAQSAPQRKLASEDVKDSDF